MSRTEFALIVVIIAGFALAGSSSTASISNAPHNAAHNISCAECHTDPLPDPADRSAVCATCHDGVSAPLALTHANAVIHGSQPAPYAGLSFVCLDCHNPHFHDQLVTIPDLYLVTATIDPGSIVDNGDNTSTLAYSSAVIKAGWNLPPHIDNADWGAKTAAGHGLILVTDKVDPDETFEILSADATQITVAGIMASSLEGNSFGIIYGQYVKNSVDPDAGGVRLPVAVRFFDRNGANSFADGDVTYDGICEVCHTQTKHFRDDGTVNALPPGPGVMDHVGREGTNCSSCHTHASGFGLGGGINCGSCHTDWGSHPTHVEAEYGPKMACYDCHDTDDYPYFISGSGVAPYDLTETDVCDSCHSAGGIYNGAVSTVDSVGAKDNWISGVYNGSMNLQAGKEKWCVGCHDDASAVIFGVSAPNMAGDDTTYGYYNTGHGKHGNQQAIGCLACHDATLAHTDGEPRTYTAAADNYQTGYRLKLIGEQEPMVIPRCGSTTEDQFRLCFNCHGSAPYIPMAGVDDNIETNFRKDVNDDCSPASVNDINKHWYHLQTAGAFNNDWDSDWDGSIGDSWPSCPACHNVHGAKTEAGYTNAPAMIRTGELIGRSSALNLDYFVNPCNDQTLSTTNEVATSTGGAFTGGGSRRIPGNGVCKMCHNVYMPYWREATGVTGCINCHGHDAGYEYATEKFSQGAGTFVSHSTHTENDSDDLIGPNVDCNDCHNTSNFPYFKSGSGGDGAPWDLSETNVCDNCHSAGGDVDGINDASVGAKNNWDNGVYNGTALAAGKELWCISCHDEVPANSKQDGSGISAPNKAGDSTTYGYYVNGHGSTNAYNATIHGQNGPGYDCLVCHVKVGDHIDHAVGDTRLQTIPDDGLDYTSDVSEVCLDCHLVGQSSNGALGYDSAAEATVHSGAISDSYNTNAAAVFPSYGDSGDYTANPGYQCEDCHEVHGTTKLAMVLETIDGNVGGASNPVAITGFEASDTDLTDLDPSATADDGVCDACHASGNDPHPDTNHSGNHNQGNAGNACMPCHPHTATFTHGGGTDGGVDDCVECHGHDAGTNYDPDMQYPYTPGDTASMGAGTSHSHSTHTETDSEDAKGPQIYCDICHDLANMPKFKNLDGSGNHTFAETDICNNCHSPGGTYDGTNDIAVGVKNNWPTSIYEELSTSTLQAGKQKWCATCHDEEPSNSKVDGTGINAPNVIGDEDGAYTFGTGWGYYKTGHGLPAGEDYPSKGGVETLAGRPVECDACHDFSTAHIDGDPRTFDDGNSDNTDASVYRQGYRLKLVDAGTGAGISTQEPLLVPWPDTGPGEEPGADNSANNYRLCVNCHPAGPFLSSADMNTNLVTAYINGTDPPVNRHWYHLRDNAECGGMYCMDDLNYSADWDGTYSEATGFIDTASSRITCVNCHNVHGSTWLAMVRDGKLINKEPGLMIWNNNDAIVSYADDPNPPDPEDLPLSASTGTLWIGKTSQNLCEHCHGDPNTTPEYRTPFQNVAQAPTLSWTGKNGYENDGVNPDSGPATGSFTFRVTYKDFNNDQPTTYEFWIDKNNNDLFDDNPDERIDMVAANSTDDNYYDGKVYTYTLSLAKAGDNTFTYKFNFADGDGTATGPPSVDPAGEVTLDNSTPTLNWTGEEFYTDGGVYPNPGGDGASFEFRITYKDADNECPPTSDAIQVWIDENDDGAFASGEMHDMTAADANDCAEGRVYKFTTILNRGTTDGELNYRFYAFDGYDVATQDHYPVTGYENQVTVLNNAGNTPPVLSWATGENCLTEGVRPLIGASGENFDFFVKYTDADGTCPPTSSDIQVWVDEDGDGYDDGDKHDLTEVDPLDTDCSDGKLYELHDHALSNIGDLNYRFYAWDGNDNASGDPVIGANVSLIDAIVVRPSGQGGDYNTVAGGIGAASTGDTILVYPNADFSAYTYSENQINVPSNKSDLTVQSACGADLTIITRSASGDLFYFNNGGPNLNFTVDGFSIQYISGSAFQGWNSASFTVKNSKIHDNQYQAVRLKTSIIATVENCEIYNNCKNAGCTTAAIVLQNGGGDLTIKGCDIHHNDHGGLQLLAWGTPEISDSIIRDHVGTGRGKAIYADNYPFMVTNTVIKDNESIDNLGGAVYIKNATGTFNGCVFTGNKAVNSSSSANTTGGGAVATDTNGTLTITNSILANNQGTKGGAIYNKSQNNATFTNVTFADNHANIDGGALWSELKMTVKNSIFWNNSADSDGNTAYKNGGAGDLMEVSHSDISTQAGEINSDGGIVNPTGNIDPAEDPLFSDSGDYHLLSISPCIDQASADYAPDTDIDGENRPQGGGDDMGADEFNNAPYLKWTGEPNYVDDGVDPDSGPGASPFEFRVDYVDDDNDEPTTIQVWVDENDNGTYDENEKYDLTETDGGDDDYTSPNGKRFSRSLPIGYYGDGVINYRFFATDGSTEVSGEPIYNKMITLTSNSVPTLEWTGETGYESDGVDPDSAPASSAFTYRVKYIDADNKPSASVQLWVDRNDNLSYDDGEDPPEKIDMVEVDVNDDDYTSPGGKLYTVSTNLAYGNDDFINYKFVAKDGFDEATGAPASDKTVEVIFSSNNAPTLEWANTTGYTADGVEPDSGAGLDPGLNVGTSFIFLVKYSDADDVAPSVIQVWIDKDDDGEYEDGVTPDEVIDLTLDPDAGNDGNFTNGEIYKSTDQTIPLNDGSVTYRFYAKDAIAEVVSGDPVTNHSITLVNPRVVCHEDHIGPDCEYDTIQAAINASSNGDVIMVRDGTYPENINYKDVGGTAEARNVTVQSENGPELTSIVGDPGDIYAVVTLQLYANEDCVLDGFTIDNQATVLSQWTHGIQLSSGSELTIRNCRIRGNETTAAGAGVYVYGSKAAIINSKIGDAIYKNTCSKGCGVYAASLTDGLKIIDSEISYNESDQEGAGLKLEDNGQQQTTIVNTTFSYNLADQYGGAINAKDSSFSISGNSKFINNEVTDSAQFGGAICVANYAGSDVQKMEIKDSQFTNNKATDGAGAIYVMGDNTAPTLTIDNCTFDNNSVLSAANWGYGGAMSFNNVGYETTISNSIFTNNRAEATTKPSYGGAIYVVGSKVTITNTDIGAVGKGNTAEDYGGGLYANTASAQVTVTGGSIIGNSAANAGGIMNNGGTVSVTGARINSNTATTSYGGGVYLGGSGTLNLTKTYVQGNLAGQRGGGLYVINGSNTATLINCIVSGNTVDSVNGLEGGGIYNIGQLNLYSSTVAGNSAPTGGGLFINGVSGGNLDMSNSIFWDNVASNYPEIRVTYFNAGFTMIFSDIEGGFSGGETNHDNIDLNPLFVQSDPASTVGTPKTSGDYRIQSSSPCIDTGGGTADLNPDPPTDDIEGDDRPYGSGWDMGADEKY